MEKCKECPAVVHVSSKPSADEASVSKGPGMIHVDDSLLLLPLKVGPRVLHSSDRTEISDHV